MAAPSAGVSATLKAFWNHPAGPKTTITATGVIWSRYSTQITPVNYNLLAVNLFMAVTGSYQLYRKLSYEYSKKEVAK